MITSTRPRNNKVESVFTNPCSDCIINSICKEWCPEFDIFYWESVDITDVGSSRVKLLHRGKEEFGPLLDNSFIDFMKNLNKKEE